MSSAYACILKNQLPAPQDETWTDFDGPSWIQYDLFRKNKTPGSKKVNLAKFMLRALPAPQMSSVFSSPVLFQLLLTFQDN